MAPRSSERSPLLRDQESNEGDNGSQSTKTVQFSEKDKENPKQWPLSRKYIQVFLIFMIALTCTLTGSIFVPASATIAEEYGVSSQIVLVGQATFVCFLGIGPLILAPMSETFGRRKVFLTCLFSFTVLQLPTALAPNITTFIAIRTISGFFGSVGVANGGGSISDMFDTANRATVLGWYLLGPLLGPTIGPLIGGIISANCPWRWSFWFTLILCSVLSIACYALLHETHATTILQKRKSRLESEDPDTTFEIEGAKDQSIWAAIASNSTRATKILLTQPIVLTMSTYQALIFSSMYSLYSNYSNILSAPPYSFSPLEVALAYLAPATGFCVTAAFIVPFIDKVYASLKSKAEDGEGKPEFRLPLAGIGAVFLPASLFWFGWSVQDGQPWPVPLFATMLFGASQVSIFNTCQNYYIDSFEQNAASALAAGAFLRSMVGGIIPLFVPKMFDSIGYGWGMSVFGFISVVLMPAPALFFWYGGHLRKKFATEL